MRIRPSWSPFFGLLVLGPVLQLLPNAVLLAQQAPTPFTHLTVADGLSHNDVTSITQDSLGFIWIGTKEGLSRFDGHEFRVFRPLPFDSTSLGGATVEALARDGGDGLWVATSSNGLSRYDARRERFTRFSHGPVTEGHLGTHDLWHVLRARDGSVWLGSRSEGLVRFDPATGAVEHYDHDPSGSAGRSSASEPSGLSDPFIQALLEGPEGDVWIGTQMGGLNRLDPETGRVRHYRHEPTRPGSLPGDEVRALLLGHSGPESGPTLWVGTGGGLARYEPGEDRVVVVGERVLGAEPVTALLQTPDGVLWIGRENGLDRFDPETEEVTRLRHDPRDPLSLGPGAVQTLFLDRSGVLWVGKKVGVSRFAWSAPRFPVVRHDPSNPNSLGDPGVWSFLQDRDGVLWVGTERGLDRFDPQTGAVTHYRHDPDDPSTLTPGWVVSLLEDSDGAFWVGTRRSGAQSGGLNRFDRETGRVIERFVEDPADPASLRSDNPWRLFEDSQRRLWVLSGGAGCLNLMDRAAGTFTPFCHDPDNADSPGYDAAKSVVEHPSGVLWFATWGGGLDRFDTHTGAWTHLRHDPERPDTPSADFILALHKGSDDVLWLGTNGAGLDRYDLETGAFTHFSQANSALPNDVVYAIEGDDAGGVWLGTNRGLSRLDPETGRFRNFGLENGLQDLEYNATASYRASGGELFFGGIRGFNRFFADQVMGEPGAPPVMLTALRVRGVPMEVGGDSPLEVGLPFAGPLRLRPDQQDLSFSFAALDFSEPDQTRYRYLLEGYDDTWIEARPDRTATYTNLDPGTYTFRVQAATGSGVWGEGGTALSLHLARPWWVSGWAYLVYALLALGLWGGFHRIREERRQLLQRMELERIRSENLRELDDARSRFFTNVSHEFRTPLTLTLGPLDDLRTGFHGPLSAEVSAQVELAHRNAGRVLELIDQLLDVARLEAGSTRMRATRLELGAHLQGIVAAFTPLAERRSIALELAAPPGSVEIWADPEHLEKVIANLLSNALKFTDPGGTVEVTLSLAEDAARIAVRDTGAGIPGEALPRVFDRFYRGEGPAAEVRPGTGIGLALARELAHLHGGTLEVESEPGVGSTFTLALRLGRDHLAPDQVVEEGGLTTVSAPASNGLDPALEDGPPRNDGEAEEDVTTVLIVEDNEELRAFLRRHLSGLYRVLEAGDGRKGLEVARQRLPDLVISDVMMPEMDGYELCRALRADVETDFIPVILLTARAAPEDRLMGLREEADAYLTKPFSVEELLTRVRNLIAVRQRLHKRFRGTIALHPSSIEVASKDALFLEELRSVIEDHLDDEDFTVELLAGKVAHSRSHLHRRLRDLIDETPSDLIRRMRLERAAALLEAGAGSVSRIAYVVGFKSVSHFSNRFQEHFGVRPSRYVGEPVHAAEEGRGE